MAILKHKNILYCVVATILLWAMPVHAQETSLQLYSQKIKAGLVYNILKYTEWPPAKMGASPSIQVCIFGSTDPFQGYLAPMAKRTVSQRPIRIRHVLNVSEASDCHLLFVNAEEKSKWPQLRDLMVKRHVLTVSDFPGFLDAGGMIEFGTRKNRILIELNIEAVNAADLIIYDSLRKLAVVRSSDAIGEQGGE